MSIELAVGSIIIGIVIGGAVGFIIAVINVIIEGE